MHIFFLQRPTHIVSLLFPKPLGYSRDALAGRDSRDHTISSLTNFWEGYLGQEKFCGTPDFPADSLDGEGPQENLEIERHISGSPYQSGSHINGGKTK